MDDEAITPAGHGLDHETAAELIGALAQTQRWISHDGTLYVVTLSAPEEQAALAAIWDKLQSPSQETSS